jgi:EpsI family protein
VLNAMFDADLRSQVDTGKAELLQAPPGWREESAADSSWRPVQYNADLESHMRFRGAVAPIEAYVAVYREQLPGKKLGGYANHIEGTAEIVSRQAVVAGDRRYGSLELQEGDHRSVLWFTYTVADRSFTDPTLAQFWYSWRTLSTLHSPTSTVMALRADCEPTCDAARAALERFVTPAGSHP